MTDFVSSIIEVIRDLDPVLLTLLAGLGIMLETSAFIGLIVPGDTIALAAAVGVTGPTQFVALVLALVTGAVIGESIGFLLGRWAGPRIRTSALGRRLGERNWQIADHYLGKRGGLAVFLSRFLPVLHSLVPLTAGMTGMRYRRFLAWTAPASIVWSCLVVSLGATAAAGHEQLAGRVKGAGYFIAGGVAVVLLVFWALKRWFMKREQRHMQPVDDAAQTSDAPHETTSASPDAPAIPSSTPDETQVS